MSRFWQVCNVFAQATRTVPHCWDDGDGTPRCAIDDSKRTVARTLLWDVISVVGLTPKCTEKDGLRFDSSVSLVGFTPRTRLGIVVCRVVGSGAPELLARSEFVETGALYGC